MSFEAAERLAHALLFEGYVLYPYRQSSLKNQQRWTFGTLYPAAFCARADAGDTSTMQLECLLAGEQPQVRLAIRFLQFSPSTGEFQGAQERGIEPPEFAIDAPRGAPARIEAHFPIEQSRDELRARVEIATFAIAPALWRLRVVIENTSDCATRDRAAALSLALASTHCVLACRSGRFVSLLEPPAEWEQHAAACRNRGLWPVLVGEAGQADTLLASPIILYDHARVAPQSAGDLFDATEIDEVLTLRILTLTESEREEVRRTDPRARALLERTEGLSEQDLQALHGVWRGAALAPGDSVVLRPRAQGGDVFDLALAGERATIAGIEQDLEGRVHYAVTIDRDPGRDLGQLGQPGHRFFFSAEELERVP